MILKFIIRILNRKTDSSRFLIYDYHNNHRNKSLF